MGFADADLTCDGFLDGRVQVWQPRAGFRAAMDTVLLAAAVPAVAGQRVLDLGCGAGVASLCLGARVPGLVLTGVELQADYADLARRNAAANGTALAVFCADLADLPPDLRQVGFDHVMANPPFYPTGGGTAARDAGRELALREALPLADWVAVGLARLRPGGWLTLVQMAERLPDLLLAVAGRGSVSVLPVTPRAGHRANRVLIRVKKGGRAGFRLLAPLVLHDGAVHRQDGDGYSATARAVLRDGAALDWHD